ncbi:MAG: alpha-isopropylmalate synthase regulatory domain-containing protein, partial [Oscillospiraceae bacterium]
ERQPYSGQLVFAAFSGSHQDAIAKGMKWREQNDPAHWTVPYLPLDPQDIGRVYETDVIRINSQSGKGGIGYLMEQNFGYDLPAKMREDFGYIVKGISDHLHKELLPNEVYEIFQKEYVNLENPIKLVDYHFTRNGTVKVDLEIEVNGKSQKLHSSGNGRLDAVSNAIQENLPIEYCNLTYKEHALQEGSGAQAAAYVGITAPDGKIVWGVGIHNDIIAASIDALFSAINRIKK